MCKKCKELKSIWWSKAKILIYSPKSLIEGTYHILQYEASSSWRSLKLQTKKHIRKT